MKPFFNLFNIFYSLNRIRLLKIEFIELTVSFQPLLLFQWGFMDVFSREGHQDYRLEPPAVYNK